MIKSYLLIRRVQKNLERKKKIIEEAILSCQDIDS